MASEWKEVQLGEIAAELTVGYVGPMASEYVPTGIPFFRSLNIEPYRFNSTDLKFITEEFHQKTKKSALRPGDVVIVRTGKPGTCAVVPSWIEDSNCSDLVIVRTGPNLDPHFLSYYINSSAKHHVASHAVGAVQQHFNVASARTIRLLLPDIKEQRELARVLCDFDDKIELNRRMNATLEAMAQALFKSWFVDFDPVKAKAAGRAPEGMDADTAALFPSELVESELGMIPKGWKASSLGLEAQRCGGTIQTGPFGSQLHASDYVAEGIPVVMPQDIERRRISTKRIAKVLADDAERLMRHQLQVGDVVYSRRGDIERHALVGKHESGWLCGTGCLLVRLGPHWPSPVYASFALDHADSRTWLSQHAVGATMPNLNTTILSRLPLLVPSEEVLRQFENEVGPWEERIFSDDAESETLAKLRDTLLPKLISGQLRIPDAEAMAEAAL